jgi:hypothetical protein
MELKKLRELQKCSPSPLHHSSMVVADDHHAATELLS